MTTTTTPSDNSVPPKSNGKRMVARNAGEANSSAGKGEPMRGREIAKQALTRSRRKTKPAAPPSWSDSNVIVMLGQRSKTKGTTHSASARGAKPTNSGTGDKSKPRRSKKRWEPIATFVVEFQSRTGKGGVAERRTHAHHHEADRDIEWPGVAGRELYRWMMEQIGEHAGFADDTRALASQTPAKQPETGSRPTELRAESGAGVESEVSITVGAPTISVGPPRVMTAEERKRFETLPDTVKATMKTPFVETPPTGAASASGPANMSGGAGQDETPRGTEEAAPLVEAPAGPPSVALEITSVRILQPPESGQVADLYAQGRSVSGLVKGSVPMVFAVECALVRTAAAEATKGRQDFGVVIYAEDLSTHAASILGSSLPSVLKEGCLTDVAWIPPVTMSPGVYRLKIVATVRDTPPLWAYAEVMMLQVL